MEKTDPVYNKLHRGVPHENMFTKEHDGSLDAGLLKKMGLTREHMIRGDALFYQLLLPI